MALDAQAREPSHEERAGVQVAAEASPQLRLLGGFGLTRAGQPVPLPVPAQRLVAFLALRAQPLSRAHIAGNLWLDATQERALANLRSAVWRARRCDGTLLKIGTGHLGLGQRVRVDVHDTVERAHRLIDDLSTCDGHGLTADGLTRELLPDWFDDWVLLERERLRQLFLHGLEALSRRLTSLGHHARAIEAGTVVVGQEPLRESAHRVLIEAYLAEGNRNEALRQYRAYRDIMRDELGLEPSPRLTGLLEQALGRPPRVTRSSHSARSRA